MARLVHTVEAAEILGLTTAALLRLARERGVEPDRVTRWSYGPLGRGVHFWWSRRRIAALGRTRAYARALRDPRNRMVSRRTRSTGLEAAIVFARAAVGASFEIAAMDA